MTATLAARARRATESLHSLIYFAPEQDEELTAVGIRPGRMCYFASRSAPMGAVSAGVTAATFYNFNPDLVAKYIPRAWTLASPETVIAARFRAADRALRRLLGAEVVGSSELADAADLARAATTELRPDGRPIYAGHATLEWPDAPHLVLWHAASLLREYRGDGHVAVLLATGLSGLEAIVTHTAARTGFSFTEGTAQLLRGWSEDQWLACVDDLRGRGLLDESGLTDAGRELRGRIEDDTDRLDATPWEHLGETRTERLIELGKTLSRIVVGNGAFPAEMFAARR